MKYGPIIQLLFGSFPVIVASSVQMPREFLKNHGAVLSMRPRTASGKYTTYDSSDMLWSPDGPYWRQARKMFRTELFSARRMESY
ncbi:hypothetical protein MLD38_004802 [Melastoma candidum]|uniref:Uncharacterized protein n=1 Tax=Melastoma candidum TaxID=119954 RepID=A0ACB9S871_9MYRT|nr:hypothetical protein MLD38_004802 [Melastoma candidum]